MSLTTMSYKSCKNPGIQKAPITRLQRWHLLLALSFLPCIGNPSQALKIVSRPVSPTYAAVGDKVTFQCHFALAPEDLGRIDIEWSIKPADPSAEETMVIWFADRIYDHFERFKDRVHFVSPFPERGNASVTIHDLQLIDSNMYQCKVRKLPSWDVILTRLHVMEKPNKPTCYAEGVVEVGGNVVLKCWSTQGGAPMWYTWDKESNGKMIPLSGMEAPGSGDLALKVIRDDISSVFVCTARNLVGSETCTFTLEVDTIVVPVAVSSAVIVLVGSSIAAIVLAVHRRRKVVRYPGSDILMDTPSPLRQQSETTVFSETAV